MSVALNIREILGQVSEQHAVVLRKAIIVVESFENVITTRDAALDAAMKEIKALQENGTKLALKLQDMRAYGGRDQRQRLILGWAVRTFGPSQFFHKERATRLVEEALEVGQAVGLARETMHTLVDFVFNKEPGDARAELGGVATTFLALCEAMNIQAREVEREGLERTLSLDPKRAVEKHVTKVEAGLAS
jgi:NTP pyrophosphatase (non-canonical NTP hydrolase)